MIARVIGAVAAFVCVGVAWFTAGVAYAPGTDHRAECLYAALEMLPRRIPAAGAGGRGLPVRTGLRRAHTGGQGRHWPAHG